MNTSPSVILIGPAHPLRGGLASYDERLAREFQNQGFTTCIYTFSLQYPGFLFPGSTQFSDEPPPADLDIRVKINSVNPLNWWRVGNEISDLKPGVLVVRYWLPFMGPCLGTLLRRVSKNKFTRIVCIADNVIPHEKRFGDKAFTRYFLKSADAFITMSEKVLGDLKNYVKDKPTLFIPHPLYDNFGEPVSRASARQYLGLPPGDPIILFFGFIRRYKGLDILLEALAMLKGKIPKGFQKPLKLLIAGEFYEDDQPYLDQVNRLGIQDQLILKTKFIPDREVKYYLCAADVVIQPYRSATQSGVTPLAYHFEVPMIVTNVGGLPSLVPDQRSGLVAEPDPSSIAQKILEFYELGEAFFLPHLREEKKKYSWSRMVGAIMKLADDIQK